MSQEERPQARAPEADRASTRAELPAADRAFAAASRANGAGAWADIWAERGRLEIATRSAVGPEQVGAAVAVSLGRVLPRMEWVPTESGTWWDDAGWTWGRWQVNSPTRGEPADTGRYFTAWIREGGLWKVALDVSVPDCLAVPLARQFDFWSGDWKVAQRIRGDGAWEGYPARSHVRPVADGCLLVENWDGTVRFALDGMDQPSVMNGGSIRFFDLESRTWRIHWIDDRSNAFGPAFVGRFEGTKGVFVGTGPRQTRIVFDRPGTNQVEWRLEAPVGDDWMPIWTMLFTPSTAWWNSASTLTNGAAPGLPVRAAVASHDRAAPPVTLDPAFVHPQEASVVGDARPLTQETLPFPVVETFLVADPLDPDHLLASAMSVSADRSLIWASRDGGQTWSAIEAPDGRVFPGGDPMLEFDARGRAYFSTIQPVFSVWRSADGDTWKGPVTSGEGRSSDRQWVAASPPSAGADPLFAASKVAGEDGRDILLLSCSRDGGATFTAPRLVSLDSGYLQYITGLTVAEDGTVLHAYLANYARVPGPEEVFRGRRWIIRSEDKGRTWSEPVQIAENLQFGNRSWSRAMKGLGGGMLTLDRSGGSHHGTVYSTWPAVLDGVIQIALGRSTDGGRTWSEPVRVNDGGFDVDHSMPTVAVNRDGIVAVTWNDCREGPPECFRHFVALSHDGGRTFSPGRPVSDAPTCAGAESRWLNGGDAQGLIARPDGSFLSIWTSGGDRASLRPWIAVIHPRRPRAAYWLSDWGVTVPALTRGDIPNPSSGRRQRFRSDRCAATSHVPLRGRAPPKDALAGIFEPHATSDHIRLPRTMTCVTD